MSLLIGLQRGKEELSQKGAGIKKETADNIKYKTHYLLVCLTCYTRWCNLCLGNITLNGINLSWFGLFKRIPTNVTATLASQRPSAEIKAAKLHNSDPVKRAQILLPD